MKLVYSFGYGNQETDATMKDLLGGKGANLAEMSKLGLPVPPGFTITTTSCKLFYEKNTLSDTLKSEVYKSLSGLEKLLGKGFGDENNPLLVSVRSGSRVSMPGMMDTILNLGINDKTIKGLIDKTGDERFAYDSYRRFIQMYSNVVLGVNHYIFEDIINMKKEELGIYYDNELTVNDLKEILEEFKEKVKKEIGEEFPQDVNLQLWGAISAVFKSWMNERAKVYRKMNSIPEDWGTAVNIQSMVFGNMGDDSATGVAFTRDPSTGEKIFYGEYLVNAQGEDVVAGIRTPSSINIQGKNKLGSDAISMEEYMPELYKELVVIYNKLEKHYRNMQDIEFTVENSKLWILQTRSGKRTSKAAIKIAVDMVEEKLITKEEAIMRIDPFSLEQLLHPSLDPEAPRKIISRGLPASPGAACGIVSFSADETVKKANEGEKVILVRRETSPEDIHGMYAACGILTAKGGMTSHAAVVARGMGKPCVCGVSNIQIDDKACNIGGVTIVEGDIITIDGATGEIILGKVDTIHPIMSEEFKQLMAWVDEIRSLKVRANAETSDDVKAALKFGAEGIGLCRTEHMFFDSKRIIAMREMILSDNLEAREKALCKILPMQKQDFKEIFNFMGELPVTIRLLDPPLHEFLPKTPEEIKQVAEEAGIDINLVNKRVAALHENNPMLGHRGCRLAITYPEISKMQARAIIEAAIEVMSETGKNIIPEIMVPLIISKTELDIIKNIIDAEAKAAMSKYNKTIKYLVGTMIELPKAAIMAEDIAETAEFFSFGTNDLTQATLGISRDDAFSFINDYKEKSIMTHDPFVSIDLEAVGKLVQYAVVGGRKVKSNLKIGVCGEHGGDPASILFFHKIGLDYISCSPYRISIAKLAAAQAKIIYNKTNSNHNKNLIFA